MALKPFMLRKNITDARKKLDALRAKDAEFETRKAELTAAIDEAQTEEERSAVKEAVDAFDAEEAAHEAEKDNLDQQIKDLEKELEEEEAKQDTTPPADVETPKPEAENDERKGNTTMFTRSNFFTRMSAQERNEFVAREDVQKYLTEVRTAIREKRAITNVGLTIPEVMLGLLRENIEGYSKLYKHVNVRRITGEGRMVIMGDIPEGVWTECCANLNELSIGFNDVTVDCFKVAGYFKLCNATIEDSDLNLVSELLDVIGKAIGLALDKAILYGRNAAGTQNMPQGIVSRLAQTAAPSGYPATARPWADLHTTNIQTIANTVTGKALFQKLILAAAAAKNKYARNGLVWVMNESTKLKLVAEAVAVNAAGAIVTGIGNTMPIIGGVIETLEFIPDDVIIFGYFELYLLAERKGEKFATSEHVYFLADQTVMKGTARYDGTPVIAEAFAAVGINGVTPTATMTFASDTANS